MLLIILAFIFGLFLGIVLFIFKERNSSVKGAIQIDPNTKMCRVTILDPNISDEKVKTATFLVSHDAIISRDDPDL